MTPADGGEPAAGPPAGPAAAAPPAAHIPTFAALFGASAFPKASFPPTGAAFAAARQLFARDVLGPDGLGVLTAAGPQRGQAGSPAAGGAVRDGCGFGDWFDSDLSGNDQLQELDDRIEEWQKRLADRPGMRRLVVYYAGHGGTAGPVGKEQYYLAVRKSQQKNFLRNSILFAQLAMSVKQLRHPYQCFAVIDACYAGKGVADLLQGQADGPRPGGREVVETLRKQVDAELHGRGVCLLCSSPADKPSYLLPNGSATSFMWALSEAVQAGKPHGNPLLSVQELADLTWAKLQEVRREVENHNRGETDPNQMREFDAVRPQVHWPNQGGTGVNLTDEGLIPNRWVPAEPPPPLPPPPPPPAPFPAVITARQFARFVLVNSPYVGPEEAAPAAGRGGVRAYLWLPDPATFLGPEEAVRDVPIVAICDAHPPEVDRHAGLLADHGKLLEDCLAYTPSRLVDAKKRALVGLLAEVLQGTFVLSAVVPKYLLSAGLRDPQASYDAILNVVLFPLVSAHAALGFDGFAVTLSPVGPHQRGVLESALRVIRSGFPDGTARIAARRDWRDQFYLYAARFINWAESRKYHGNDAGWADLLATEFATRAVPRTEAEGPREGEPKPETGGE